MTAHPDASSPPRPDSYFSLLKKVHRNARPRTYVEIGVFEGESFRLAARSTKAIGIDPNPRLTGRLPRRWSVFAETSDEFFGRPDVAERVGKIDVAFIDGLHVFEQALRDLMYVERHMSPNGVVFVHDCLPPDASWASRKISEAVPEGWTGDVWKVVPILRRYRPDLRIEVVDAGPTGLGVVTRLDPSNRILDDQYDDIVAEYMDVPFGPAPATLHSRWIEVAPLIPVFRRTNLLDEAERKARTAWTVSGLRLRRSREGAVTATRGA